MQFLHLPSQLTHVRSHFVQLSMEFTELQTQSFQDRRGRLGLGEPLAPPAEFTFQFFGYVMQSGSVQILNRDFHMMGPALDSLPVLPLERSPFPERLRLQPARLAEPGSAPPSRLIRHLLSKAQDLTLDFGHLLIPPGPLMFPQFGHQALLPLNPLPFNLRTRPVRAFAHLSLQQFGGALPDLFDFASEAHGLLLPARGFKFLRLRLQFRCVTPEGPG